MIKKSVFLATPISGFSKEKDYIKYRMDVMNIIAHIKYKYNVYSEIEKLTGLNDYDDPGKSALEDFQKILEADIFLLIHPQRMQTSSLIELGYAIANKKNIVIVAKYRDLPFLALGLSKVMQNIKVIDSNIINNDLIDKIMNILENCE